MTMLPGRAPRSAVMASARSHPFDAFLTPERLHP